MVNQKTVLLAFHGKKSVKEKYLNRVMAHQKADEIISGKYWENGKGCAVGCTIEGSNHKRYEKELGMPEELALLEDILFEKLYEVDPKIAKKFPAEFLKAIPIGVSLQPVLRRFKARILTEVTVMPDEKKFPSVCESIRQVAELNMRASFDEDSVSQDEWSAAESAAWSAAWSAVRSAVRSAAMSAAGSAAMSAAWSAAVLKMREILLEELERSGKK